MIEIIETNIGKMTFVDRSVEITSGVIKQQLTPLLETVYKSVDVISINTHKNTVRILANGDVMPFSYQIIVASQPDAPVGFRLLGKVF